MQENRNTSCGSPFENRGTVCIDTKRVLDCCRDRDCFEDARVYLTDEGTEVINNANNVRIRKAKLVWAYVGLDNIPFNCGFYRVNVKYYVKVEGEGCLGIGRSQSFDGIAVLEKEVILYGGEGEVVAFSSNPADSYCDIGNLDNASDNAPTAIVETVEPVVLGQKITDCPINKCCCECSEIPSCVCGCLDGNLSNSNTGNKLYVSFGIFSVVRIVRPAQLLVQATDYSVPDKECTAATSDENPCALFRTMSFPVNSFKASTIPSVQVNGNNRGGCGCNS